MTRELANIALRVFNTPLLIHPAKAQVVASVLAEHIGGLAPMVASVDLDDAKKKAEEQRDGRSQMLDRFDGERRGPRVTNGFGESYVQTRYRFKNGVALITVEGSLVNRGAWIGADSGLTSYEGVKAQLASAASDPDVSRIVLDLESPGGEAVGAFEMADFVRKVAAEKEVVALVDGMAASAAYALASGASRIVTTPSGVSGSIGVVMLHLDQSAKMKKLGVAPTLIYAGGHKVDGNPFEPLPEDVRADFQAEVDQLYAMFVATVAKGRGALSKAAIRATEARTFIGQAAVDAGLADEIGTLADVASIKAAGGGRAQRRTAGMTKNAGVADDETVSKADYEAGVAAAREAGRIQGEQAGKAEGVKEGATAERKRIAAILDDDKAKGREPLARHFAFETDQSAEQALAALEKAPVEAAKETLSPLAKAMSEQRRPDLGPGGEKAPCDASHGWDSVVAKANARVSV
jgi:signal peptide peptidase SppA